MLKLGLTSVTFRNMSTYEIIKVCKRCGIDRIEWGSDVHVPAGDMENARKVREECEKNGILACSYGSYYKCGKYEDAEATFKSYVETAKTLGAKTIRIWVGEKNMEDADSDYVEKIVSELKMMCALAKKDNISIGCEFHGGTLCNNRENALEIVKRVDCDNFGMYFQYDAFVSLLENIKTLNSFLPHLKNVHVFNIDEEIKRYPISENGGEQLWASFIKVLKENSVSTNLLFEFLPEPTEAALLKEKETMNKLSGR